MKIKTAAFLICLTTGFFPSVFASKVAAAVDITQLSLEQLMETEVVSAAKAPRSLARTPSAVFVISEQDIRRSTARYIPELLRMVPGIQVAQITKSKWAVSARGFNGSGANKLLVMIDGRTVYNPLYNQVYWDVQDLLFEDIKRIEVIRGPGGAVWGSNAINGVVNIITKHSDETEGVLLKGGGGSERQLGAARFGGGIGEDFTYRTTGKYFNEDNSAGGNDAMYLGRTNARADWELDESNSLMATGDYHYGEEDIYSQSALPTAPFLSNPFSDQTISGGHALLRWNHIFSETSNGTLQTYFDQTRREANFFGETRYTWDIEWDHRFSWGTRQELVYGFGYRLQADDTDGSFAASLDPENRTTDLLQGFIQDTIAIVQDHLWFTGGLKAEHNDFSGWEFMPSARLLWTPHEKHSFWTAFSRALRIPSRVNHDIEVNNWAVPGTRLSRFTGDTTRESERVLAYEGGYRVQIHKKVSADIAIFYNDYNNLISASSGGASFSENGYTVFPFRVDDGTTAETYGAELALNTQLVTWWNIQTAYTFLEMQVHADRGDVINSHFAEGQSPEHQLHFTSHMNLPANFELDAALRFVDRLNNTAVLTPSYWEMDVRLGWRPVEPLLLSVTGTNLFREQHLEFPDSAAHRPQVERAVYAEATINF